MWREACRADIRSSLPAPIGHFFQKTNTQIGTEELLVACGDCVDKIVEVCVVCGGAAPPCCVSVISSDE